MHSQVPKVHSPNLLERNLKWGSENSIGSIIIFHLSISYEQPNSSYCVMWYFWWGGRGKLKLITRRAPVSLISTLEDLNHTESTSLWFWSECSLIYLCCGTCSLGMEPVGASVSPRYIAWLALVSAHCAAQFIFSPYNPLLRIYI